MLHFFVESIRKDHRTEATQSFIRALGSNAMYVLRVCLSEPRIAASPRLVLTDTIVCMALRSTGLSALRGSACIRGCGRTRCRLWIRGCQSRADRGRTLACCTLRSAAPRQRRHRPPMPSS